MFINQILTKLKSLVYSKSETDSLLNGKASSSHTHTKSQITDFPTIPSKTSQLTNDSGFITSAVKESSMGDNQNYCLLYGNLLIQFGTNVFSAQSGSVTFKKSFSSMPIVIVNYGDDVGFGSPCCSDEAHTTYFTAKRAAGSDLWRCNWIAIGRA